MANGLTLPVYIKYILKNNNIINKVNNNLSKTQNIADMTSSAMKYWPKTIQESVNKAKKLQAEFKKNNTLVNDMGRKLKSIFAAYGGVMTIRAVVEVTDTITQAENQLNYSNGGDAIKTEETKDKIYAAAMRSRGSYADMLEGVGKDLVLAMDKFGSEDNAIKFEETMQKAFAISGSPIEAINSSMYQLRQGIASGKLQGDEMKSVAEGATLAYTKMEEYVQGVLRAKEAEKGLSKGTLGSTKSLRELGSEGVISGEMVVAAVLASSEAIDEAFEDTQMKLSDVATKINNVWTKSFDPIQDTISEFLNSDKGEKFVNGITIAVQGLVGVIGVLVNVAVNSATWIVDNWYWVQYIVYAVAIAIMYLAAVAIAQKLWKAILMISTNPFTLWVIGIALVIAWVVRLANTVSNGCEFIYNVCYVLAMAIIALFVVVLMVHTFTTLTIMTTTQMTVLFIIAIIAVLLMFFIKCTGEIMGGIYVVGAFFKNVWNGMMNIGLALWEVLKATAHNIKAAFVNTWLEVKAKFWDFVSAVLTGVKKVADLANKLLGVFGVEIDVSGLENKIKDAESKAQASRDKKLDYESLGEAWNSKINTYDSFESGWSSEAYGSGYNKGIEIQNSINGLFDKAKGGFSEFGNNITNGIDKALNIDHNFDANDPANALNTSDPSELAKDVGNTADNTEKIADSMDLTDEDLEYLRRVADMEWKKEFTTASITVDMSNYNTISGDGDLDGIVTKLADKLYEELDSVANGVYE